MSSDGEATIMAGAKVDRESAEMLDRGGIDARIQTSPLTSSRPALHHLLLRPALFAIPTVLSFPLASGRRESAHNCVREEKSI